MRVWLQCLNVKDDPERGPFASALDAQARAVKHTHLIAISHGSGYYDTHNLCKHTQTPPSCIDTKHHEPARGCGDAMSTSTARATILSGPRRLASPSWQHH